MDMAGMAGMAGLDTVMDGYGNAGWALGMMAHGMEGWRIDRAGTAREMCENVTSEGKGRGQMVRWSQATARKGNGRGME